MPHNATAAPASAAAPAVLAPANLPFQLHLLVQGMHRRMQTVLQPHDLTPLHWGILCCLWQSDNLTTSDLARQLEQLGGTITIALNGMTSRKLIRRQRDPADGRIIRVRLTPRGQSMQRMLVPPAAALIRTFFADLSPEQYAQFAGCVQHLRERVSAAA